MNVPPDLDCNGIVHLFGRFGKIEQLRAEFLPARERCVLTVSYTTAAGASAAVEGLRNSEMNVSRRIAAEPSMMTGSPATLMMTGSPPMPVSPVQQAAPPAVMSAVRQLGGASTAAHSEPAAKRIAVSPAFTSPSESRDPCRTYRPPPNPGMQNQHRQTADGFSTDSGQSARSQTWPAQGQIKQQQRLQLEAIQNLQQQHDLQYKRQLDHIRVQQKALQRQELDMQRQHRLARERMMAGQQQQSGAHPWPQHSPAQPPQCLRGGFEREFAHETRASPINESAAKLPWQEGEHWREKPPKAVLAPRADVGPAGRT